MFSHMFGSVVVGQGEVHLDAILLRGIEDERDTLNASVVKRLGASLPELWRRNPSSAWDSRDQI